MLENIILTIKENVFVITELVKHFDELVKMADEKSAK